MPEFTNGKSKGPDPDVWFTSEVERFRKASEPTHPIIRPFDDDDDYSLNELKINRVQSYIQREADRIQASIKEETDLIDFSLNALDWFTEPAASADDEDDEPMSDQNTQLQQDVDELKGTVAVLEKSMHSLEDRLDARLNDYQKTIDDRLGNMQDALKQYTELSKHQLDQTTTFRTEIREDVKGFREDLQRQNEMLNNKVDASRQELEGRIASSRTWIIIVLSLWMPISVGIVMFVFTYFLQSGAN